MSRNVGSRAQRGRSVRVALVGVILTSGTVAAVLGAAGPAVAVPAPTPTASAVPHPAGTALAVDLAAGTVLTLPAKDGLRDSAVARILSASSGRVDLDAVRGRTTVHLGSGLPLTATATSWSRSVRIDVGRLTAGTWRLRAQRSADHAVQARSRALPVGSGAPVHVAVRPAARTLYPYRDGTLDSALVTVTAKDETNAPVPVTGRVRIDAGKHHVTRTLTGARAVQLPITALPLGPATITTEVSGPGGAKAVRHTSLTLAPTGVGALRIARSSSTVQPVHDGFLDSVVLTTTGAASAGSSARVSGTLTVSRGNTIAAVYRVRSGAQHAFTWDGRVNAMVVSGTYTVTLALKGPQGPVRTRSTTLIVSKQHLPYAVRDMFTVGSGNQQGLAVWNNRFYVGYDIGNDQSRIDVFDGSGVLTSSLGPLPIPHVAELAYSTTTNLLYAATGGANTPTKIFALDPSDPQWGLHPATDPASVIKATYDFSSTLGNNAMVAVDDVNKRLLVFSGATGAFRISSVTMTPSAETNADGTPVVPAGTITGSSDIAINGVPQGMDLVGQQLWIYTSGRRVNRVEKYDLATASLFSTQAATSADLYWGGEGEGMATVAADTGDGLPAWIYVGAHNPVKGGPDLLGELVPVTDAD